MAEAVLERELNPIDQRTARVRDVALEERRQTSAPAGYEAPRANESAWTSPAMPKNTAATQSTPADPTLERIHSYYAVPAAPERNHDLFRDYEYMSGELVKKLPGSDIAVPLFETAKNVVEEKYFEIPAYEVQETAAAMESVVLQEEDDALPTRRTMETVIRPAALMEMETTDAGAEARATTSLSLKTKLILASVIGAIVLAIILICVNSFILRSLDSDLTNLKGRVAEERTTYEQLIEESNRYTDPDSDIVAEWAENNGMTR